MTKGFFIFAVFLSTFVIGSFSYSVYEKSKTIKDITYEKFAVKEIGMCSTDQCKVLASGDKYNIYITVSNPVMIGETFTARCYTKTEDNREGRYCAYQNQ